ncbi:MAG: CHASE2 domain-containing protein, partial [Pseudobdellovibrionaceae bacterium]
MKNEFTTITFSLVFALVITYLSHQYLHYKSLPQIARPQSLMNELLEGIDSNYTDVKTKIRGERKPNLPVVLVAIDEDSLRHVGRWPWSRDIMSQLTQNLIAHGASAIGFDIIFSEPEKANPENDLALAKVISENSDKIVLGTFNESQMNFLSFQDYCLNEAFLAAGGDQIIKLNPTFIVENSEEKFDGLEWNHLFGQLFSNVQSLAQIKFLKENKKTSLEDLSPYKQKYLETLKIKSLYHYCEDWLTAKDPLHVADLPALEPIYTKLFSKIPDLATLDLPSAISQFQNRVLFNAVPQSVDWTPNIKPIQEASLYSASFNASLDADGYVRKYPLFYRTGNRIGSSYIPSLALQTFLVAKGYRAEIQLKASPRNKNLKGVAQVKLIDTKTDPEKEVGQLPVDLIGRLIINYYGKRQMLPYVSAEELLSDEPTIKVSQKVYDPESQKYWLQTEPEIVQKKNFFKDRAVIVGATAEALYDLRNTALENNFPGPEIHLTMLANLVEGNFLKSIEHEGKNLIYILAIVG